MSAGNNTTFASVRKLNCARCGTAFNCGLGGECWCASEPYRLPMPNARSGEDCLCPDCLRKAVVQIGNVST